MTTSQAAPSATATRALLLGARRIPVVLPSRRDPRMRLSVVIIALQVLGQTSLGFKVSLAQILVSIALAGLIEAMVIWRREHVLAWPASALLTGNSVAFILRATGTRHGDWWSLHGIQYFILAVVLSLLAKYVIRVDGRHVFNPSNAGLVWTLLVIGPAHVFPQYLWWGPVHTGLTLALVVIALGAVWVLRSVGKMTSAIAFFVVFAALVAIVAAAGQSFVAIWHSGPISGGAYWTYICLSPEIFIFVFFMMSDPRTSPASRRGQLAYGAGTAALAVILLAPQETEFGVKVAILASLTFVCALTALGRAMVVRREAALTAEAGRHPSLRERTASLRTPAVLAALIIALAAPADTLALSGDKHLPYLEQGLTGTRNPQ